MWTATSPDAPPVRDVTRAETHGSVSATSSEPAGDAAFKTWRISPPDSPTVDMRNPVAIDVAFGRLRVKRALLPEQDALVNERRELITRRFETGRLERHDRQRLRTLEWKLSLIEDAILGPELDERARYLSLKTELAKQLDSFVKDMKRVRPMAARPRRKGRRS